MFVSREEEFERGSYLLFCIFFTFVCFFLRFIELHDITLLLTCVYYYALYVYLLRINQSFHFLSSDEESAAFDARDAFFLGALSDGDGDGSRGVAEFVDGFREDASDGEVFSGDSFG